MEIINDAGKSVPITILTGRLGAGKTTLLNRILTENHGLRMGILVNDFGSINIDAELVVRVDDNMITLANGCAWCQIRDDLVESVVALLARPETAEYILRESSGLADRAGSSSPSTIPGVRDRIVAHSEHPPLMVVKLHQVGFADILILNKVGLADPPARAGFNSQAGERSRSLDHDHSRVFSTWSYETDQPLGWKRCGKRCGSCRRLSTGPKGVVYRTDAPRRRAVLQVVGRRVDISIQLRRASAHRELGSSPLVRLAVSTQVCWKRQLPPASRLPP